MLSIRFTRVGRKKTPSYRVVVMDKRKDPWANFIEKLGFYNPRTKETTLNKERIEYWIKKGAKASETVHNLLIKNGILSGNKKKSVKITKTRAEKMNKEKADKEAATLKATEDKKKTDEDAKAKVEAPAEQIPETPVVEEKPVESAPATASVETTAVEEASADKEVPVVEEKPAEEAKVE